MASILLVEDSGLVQAMVINLLEQNGHTVRIATRALEGIRMVKADHYDLILMDLNLPGLRGENAIRVIRRNLRLNTPIIVLSGEITQNILTLLMPLGVSGFVSKSEHFVDKLLEELNKAL